MNKPNWSVGVIRKSDGHDMDGIFITRNYEILKRFASTLRPLTVMHCRFQTERAAREFYFSIYDGYVNIDPERYINEHFRESLCAKNVD